MSLLTMIVSVALLVPFFGWGVYTLRARYQFHEELHRAAEWTTIAAVAAFFLIEMSLLRNWMADQHPLMYALTALALTVAMAALYGPIMVSLASSVFVQSVMPDIDNAINEPQFGPAESLERVGDFESALNEYLVIARIFPKDPETSLRIANNLMKLDRLPEAAKAFERALRLTQEEDQALAITNRLHALHKDRMDEPEEAKQVLERFIKRFPDAERADSVIRRISDKNTRSSIDRVKKKLVESAREETGELEIELEAPSDEIAAMLPDSTWSGPDRGSSVPAESSKPAPPEPSPSPEIVESAPAELELPPAPKPATSKRKSAVKKASAAPATTPPAKTTPKPDSIPADSVVEIEEIELPPAPKPAKTKITPAPKKASKSKGNSSSGLSLDWSTADEDPPTPPARPEADQSE